MKINSQKIINANKKLAIQAYNYAEMQEVAPLKVAA